MSSLIWEQLAAIPAADLPLTYVDVETTGLNPYRGDAICEVAAVHCRGDREVERFVTLVNPCRGISPGAAAVNGITADMVHDAPRFAAVADDVLRLLRSGITVAHNAPFDLAFLAQAFHGARRPLPSAPVLDTLALARRCFSFPSNSLGRVASSLGLAGGGHRALQDALTTRAVFERFLDLLERSGRRLTLDSLISLQGGPVTWPARAQPSPVPLPPELGEAVQEGRRLRLTYLSASGTLTERYVDPIEVVPRQGEAYLLAYCHLRQEQRSFRVDRIVRWEPT